MQGGTGMDAQSTLLARHGRANTHTTSFHNTVTKRLIKCHEQTTDTCQKHEQTTDICQKHQAEINRRATLGAAPVGDHGAPRGEIGAQLLGQAPTQRTCDLNLGRPFGDPVQHIIIHILHVARVTPRLHAEHSSASHVAFAGKRQHTQYVNVHV